MALNPFKCAIAMKRGVLLGYVVSIEGMSSHMDMIKAIQATPSPTNLKEVERFVGQIKWHNRYLRYLSDVCAPLTQLTKKGV